MRKAQDDISSFFKESFDSYTPEVPDHLWKGIENGLQQPNLSSQTNGAKTLGKGSTILSKAVLAAVAIGATIAGVVYLNNSFSDSVNDESNEFVISENVEQNKALSEKQVVEKVEEEPGTKSETLNEPEKINAIKESAASNFHENSLLETNENQDAIGNSSLNYQTTNETEVKTTSDESTESETTILVQVKPVTLDLSSQEGEVPLKLSISTNCRVKNCLFEIRTPNGEVWKAPTSDTNVLLKVSGVYQVSMVSRGEDGNLYSQSKFVTVKDKAVKEELKESTITDLPQEVPKTFSPNGDGLNDYLKIPTKGIEVKQFEWVVFDRNGRTILKTLNPEFEWDGTQNNQIVPEGTYFYYVTVYDVEGNAFVKRGNVYISR